MTKQRTKVSSTDWRFSVADNSYDSYALVVNLAILILWEARVNTKEEAEDVLDNVELGLDVNQERCAIEFVSQNDVEAWFSDARREPDKRREARAKRDKIGLWVEPNAKE